MDYRERERYCFKIIPYLKYNRIIRRRLYCNDIYKNAMENAIKLKVNTELNNYQQIMINKLKKSLISKGCTEIIHELHQDPNFKVNSFDTIMPNKKEVHQFIEDFIDLAHLSDIIIII